MFCTFITRLPVAEDTNEPKACEFNMRTEPVSSLVFPVASRVITGSSTVFPFGKIPRAAMYWPTETASELRMEVELSTVTVVLGPSRSFASAVVVGASWSGWTWLMKISSSLKSNVQLRSVTVLPFRATTYPLNPSVKMSSAVLPPSTYTGKNVPPVAGGEVRGLMSGVKVVYAMVVVVPADSACNALMPATPT